MSQPLLALKNKLPSLNFNSFREEKVRDFITKLSVYTSHCNLQTGNTSSISFIKAGLLNVDVLSSWPCS